MLQLQELDGLVTSGYRCGLQWLLAEPLILRMTRVRLAARASVTPDFGTNRKDLNQGYWFLLSLCSLRSLRLLQRFIINPVQ